MDDHDKSNSGANKNMNSIDDDRIVVIPDTPDRVCKNRKNVCEDATISAHSNSRTAGLPNNAILDRRVHFLVDNMQTSKTDSHQLGDFGDTEQNCLVGSSAAPYMFRIAPTSRTVGDKNMNPKVKRHSDHHDVEDGKFSSSRFPEMSYDCYNKPVVPIFDHGDIMKSSKAVISLDSPAVSSMSTRNEGKGKVKIGNDIPVHCDDHPREVNDKVFHVAQEHNTGEGVSMPSVRGPNAVKKKRLVRNGCISPHNIAKAKVSADSSFVSSYAECNSLSGASRNVTDVDKVIAVENAANRSKGKGVLMHPPFSKGHEDRRVDVRLNDSSKNVLGKSSSSSVLSALEPASVLDNDEVCTPSPSKKQKMLGSCSSTQEEEREVICLSSGGKSSAAKSIVGHCGHPQKALDSPVVVGNFSPECGPQIDNGNETRAIQLQVDEIMAQELQEQLYNEMPDATRVERASQLAWEGMGPYPTSFRGRQRAHVNIGARSSNTRRASQMPSLRHRLLRPRIPSSSVARLRARINRHPNMDASGSSGRLFPSDMDIEMRIELLEALEAVADDDIRMVNQLLHSDQEFGENDYEMLLALDENNHEHLGASVAQIANLPESTVDSDSTEVCSICLETPAIGDTMRHLRCLHKFHKDCIDQWLRRKRSCPICKSDI